MNKGIIILKKLGLLLGLIIALIVVVLGIYNDQENRAVDAIKTRPNKISKQIDQRKPIAFLLLGVDTGSDGRINRGLSDSMMVVTLNPARASTVVYSIPRDSLAEMADEHGGNIQKINAAYEIGKADMAKKTVSQFLGMPIDYSVTVDMGALKEMVDFVGGITLDTVIDVNLNGQVIPQGHQHLNGDQALAYSRMRYQDPRGDYGRQLRQQEVLKQVAQKIQKPKYLMKLGDLMTKLGKQISTDFTADQIKQLIRNYHQSSDEIVSSQLLGKTAWLNGSAYQIISTEDLQAASNRLRENLALPEQTLTNTETRLNDMNPAFFDDESPTTYFNVRGFNLTRPTNNSY